MVDLVVLERFLADPRSKRARVDGRIVTPVEPVGDPGAPGGGVRVEHVGDPGWAAGRGFDLDVWRDVWSGVVAVEEVSDLEVHPSSWASLVDPEPWSAWVDGSGA